MLPYIATVWKRGFSTSLVPVVTHDLLILALSQPGVPSDHKAELIMFSPNWMGFRITVGELPKSVSSHFLLSVLICNMGLLWCSLYAIKRTLKVLWHGRLLHFFSPYSLRNSRTYLWMTKSQLCVKQICLPSSTSNVTNDKTELLKHVGLTSFQKPKLHSVSISLKHVHPCFLLYLLRYSYFLLTSWAVIFKVSLHSLAVPTVWTVTNLVTQLP